MGQETRTKSTEKERTTVTRTTETIRITGGTHAERQKILQEWRDRQH